jgi:hypothetical protein
VTGVQIIRTALTVLAVLAATVAAVVISLRH